MLYKKEIDLLRSEASVSIIKLKLHENNSCSVFSRIAEKVCIVNSLKIPIASNSD